jgi:hypothetical protein
MDEPSEGEEIINYPLAPLLADLVISVSSVPLVASKQAAAHWFRKHLSNQISNIYIVGWEESEDPSLIIYPQLLEKIESNQNSLFIITDPLTFSGYGEEIKIYNHHNNFFLILEEIIMPRLDTESYLKAFKDVYFFWPAPLDLPIEISYIEKSNLIAGGHLHQYQEEFMKWRKENHGHFDVDNHPPHLLGVLNVFLDDSVPSLESVSINAAFSRSPKLRDLIATLLFHNKKRHFVQMINSKRGITAFESLYNRLPGDRPPSLHIIRSDEPLETKMEKIEDINSSNRPLIVISDFIFVDDMALKNIDYYHLTSGGDYKDILAIMSMVKGFNYTGSYPRKFNVVSYTTETPYGDIPLDSLLEKDFEEKIKMTMDAADHYRRTYHRLGLIENELYAFVE